MECALVSKLPEGPQWTYEVKLDGYRAIGVKTSRQAILYSRNHKNFNNRFPQIADALVDLPADTVIDGEVVALDESGRPDFHGLQHFTAEASRIRYFVFDLLILGGRDLTSLPLIERRKLLAGIKIRSSWILISEKFDTSAAEMLAAVRQQLEGVVAKRKSSLYEAGKRTGSWAKMRINKGQEFVIGGFMPGPHGVDSIIVGYYRGKDLYYVAGVRNGFVPANRRMVFEKLKTLVTDKCPFVNLPETGRTLNWLPSLSSWIGRTEIGFVIPSLSRSAMTKTRERWLRKRKLSSPCRSPQESNRKPKRLNSSANKLRNASYLTLACAFRNLECSAFWTMKTRPVSSKHSVRQTGGFREPSGTVTIYRYGRTTFRSACMLMTTFLRIRGASSINLFICMGALAQMR